MSVPIRPKQKPPGGPGGSGTGRGGAGPNRRSLVQETTEQVDARRFPWRLALAGAGALASIYLTYLHFAGGAPIGCTESTHAVGLVNCADVLTSAQSAILGVPVSVFGLVFFLGMLALVLWQRQGSSPTKSQLSLVWTMGGALVVCGLVYTELFTVNHLCLWCSFTHVMALGLFATEIWPTTVIEDRRADARRREREHQARERQAQARKH